MSLPIISAIKTIVLAAASPITGLLNSWQKRKTAKLDSELAIHAAKTDAQIEKISTGQKADIAWEQTSISTSGWKDEWFTIILSIPAILCFIPGMDVYVVRGFAALSETPKWYQWAFLVAVGSAFGYRKIADFMNLKKGE